MAGALCFWRRTGDFLLFARHWWCLFRKTTGSTKIHWRSHAETHAEAMQTCFPPCTHGAHSAHSAQSVGAFDEQATSHSEHRWPVRLVWAGQCLPARIPAFNPVSSGSYWCVVSPLWTLLLNTGREPSRCARCVRYFTDAFLQSRICAAHVCWWFQCELFSATFILQQSYIDFALLLLVCFPVRWGSPSIFALPLRNGGPCTRVFASLHYPCTEVFAPALKCFHPTCLAVHLLFSAHMPSLMARNSSTCDYS